MLDPKKAIPKLAVAALALTGCGGDGGGAAGNGGTGGNGGSGGSNGTLASSLNAFCMKLVDCFPGYYDSTQDCVNYISNYYGFDQISAACEAAGISYFDCGAELSCAELDASSNSCDDEFMAAIQACSDQP